MHCHRADPAPPIKPLVPSRRLHSSRLLFGLKWLHVICCRLVRGGLPGGSSESTKYMPQWGGGGASIKGDVIIVQCNVVQLVPCVYVSCGLMSKALTRWRFVHRGTFLASILS